MERWQAIFAVARLGQRQAAGSAGGWSCQPGTTAGRCMTPPPLTLRTPGSDSVQEYLHLQVVWPGDSDNLKVLILLVVCE